MDRFGCLRSQAQAVLTTACGNRCNIPWPLTAPKGAAKSGTILAQDSGTQRVRGKKQKSIRYPAHGPRRFWPSTRARISRAHTGAVGASIGCVPGVALSAVPGASPKPPASLEATPYGRRVAALGILLTRPRALAVGRARTPEWRTPMTTPLCHSWDMM